MAMCVTTVFQTGTVPHYGHGFNRPITIPLPLPLTKLMNAENAKFSNTSRIQPKPQKNNGLRQLQKGHSSKNADLQVKRIH
jgi:hypothetical protein